MANENESDIYKRMSDHPGNVAWLHEQLRAVTDRECVVEYMPGQRANPLDIFGNSQEREALYRVTIKGVGAQPHFQIARIALRDAEHVRNSVGKLFPQPETAPNEPEAN